MGPQAEIIEGEYEVIDEWDADETYYRRQDRYAYQSRSTLCYLRNSGDKHWDMADYSFIGTVFGLDLYYQLLYLSKD